MRKLIMAVLLSSLLLVLAACGGGEESGSGDAAASGSGTLVDIVASNWDFDKDTYTVPAGDVTLNLKNKQGYHGIEISGTDVKIEGEGSVTTNLSAGEYTITCIIPCGEGHAEMTAKLVVE